MPKPFFLVIVDRDRKVFSVHQLTDDTAHTDAVVKQQEAGREINCFSYLDAKSREEVAQLVVSGAPFQLFQLVPNALLSP